MHGFLCLSAWVWRLSSEHWKHWTLKSDWTGLWITTLSLSSFLNLLVANAKWERGHLSDKLPQRVTEGPDDLREKSGHTKGVVITRKDCLVVRREAALTDT